MTNNFQHRKSKTQNWSLGNTVKVGFLTLKVTGRTEYSFLLTSLDGKKK